MLLPLQPGTLPPGVCYANEQDRLLAYAENLEAVLAGGLAFYNYGDTTPSVENQGYPWLNTNDTQWYTFSGAWRRKRPLLEQDPNYRILWVGDSADIDTVGGGSASNPLWEIDHAFDGRSPMGPGDIASANPAKNLAVGESYGAGAHAQTAEELYPHTHTPDPTLADGFLGHAVVGAPATYNVLGGGDTISMGQTAAAGGNASDDAEPAPIVHPVYGIWILKPTSNQYIYA